MAGWGNVAVAPYCTCGLVFKAKSIMTAAPLIRREWVEHVRRVAQGSETKDPLA